MSDGVFVSDNNNPRLLMSALFSTEVVLVSCRPRYRLSVGGVVVVAQRGLQDEDECLTSHASCQLLCNCFQGQMSSVRRLHFLSSASDIHRVHVSGPLHDTLHFSLDARGEDMHVLGYLHARARVADDRADHAIAVCGLYTRETEHRAVFVFVVKTVARVVDELSRHVVRLCVRVCVRDSKSRVFTDT